MKKLLVVSLVLCSVLTNAEQTLDVRVADALMNEAALGHVVTAVEESEPVRKNLIKSLLADCNLTNVELQALKAMVREIRELLPVVILLQNDFNRSYAQALSDALKNEFACEIASGTLRFHDGKLYKNCRCTCEHADDRTWKVADTITKQFESDSKYSRYFKAQERLEEIGEQVQDFLKRMEKQFVRKMAQKGDSLKAAAVVYAGLVFNQLTEGLIEAINELQVKAA